MKHVSESDLALYASGDLGGWPRWTAALHVRGCAECRELMEAHQALCADVRRGTLSSPPELDWNRLSAEMTANIHVGLAAGECVMRERPREHRSMVSQFWRPTAAVLALTIVFTAAWWLNVPASDKAALGRIIRGLPARGSSLTSEDRGPLVAATPAGIEFRENGSSLGLGLSDAELVGVSLNVEGSASAHYVDDDTGQVTITTVYVQ